MQKTYSKKQFQHDLEKLSDMIKNFTPKVSGGKKDKDGKNIKMRTFEVVNVNGKEVTPHGNYQIKADSKLGPETAASKAAKMLCRKIKKDGGKHTECQGRTLVIREKTRGSSNKLYGPYVVVVDELTPDESSRRTQSLIEQTVKRLVSKGMKKDDAYKKVKSEINKVTHKVFVKLSKK